MSLLGLATGVLAIERLWETKSYYRCQYATGDIPVKTSESPIPLLRHEKKKYAESVPEKL